MRLTGPPLLSAVVARSSNWRRLPWYVRHRLLTNAASEARRLDALASHRHCHVEFQGPVRLGPGFQLDIPDDGTLVVGPGVDLRRRFVCEISGSGRVVIGGGSIFTAEALIQCTTSIEIGPRCVFGQSTLIVDGNHRFRDSTKHMLEQGYDYRPITIGEAASIMTKCTIIADVGHHAFVGANSVVTKPIPPYCLAFGVPARVVEYFGPPDDRPPELDDA
jgi:acetyltransferase-like isoleucine patch superfamily enzyme